MVDVILLQRVENLGQMGQVVKVRPGFARNYLLPQKKALRATPSNIAYFETQRIQLEAQNLEHKKEAEQVSGKLEGLTVVVIRQAGESGQLYGSVNARDVAEAVTAAGFTVARSQIVLDKAIKTLGLYQLRVALHPEVSVQVTVNVAQSPEEAEMQAAGANPVKLAEEAAAREAAAAAEAVFAPPAPEKAATAKQETKEKAATAEKTEADKAAKPKQAKKAKA